MNTLDSSVFTEYNGSSYVFMEPQPEKSSVQEPTQIPLDSFQLSELMDLSFWTELDQKVRLDPNHVLPELDFSEMDFIMKVMANMESNKQKTTPSPPCSLNLEPGTPRMESQRNPQPAFTSEAGCPSTSRVKNTKRAEDFNTFKMPERNNVPHGEEPQMVSDFTSLMLLSETKHVEREVNMETEVAGQVNVPVTTCNYEDLLPPTPDLLKNHTSSRKRRREKSDKTQRIKKPRNAFMLFACDERNKVRKEMNNCNSAVANVELGKRWKLLSAEKRAVYEEWARNESKAHNEMTDPDWIPVRRIRKKDNSTTHKAQNGAAPPHTNGAVNSNQNQNFLPVSCIQESVPTTYFILAPPSNSTQGVNYTPAPSNSTQAVNYTPAPSTQTLTPGQVLYQLVPASSTQA